MLLQDADACYAAADATDYDFFAVFCLMISSLLLIFSPAQRRRHARRAIIGAPCRYAFDATLSLMFIARCRRYAAACALAITRLRCYDAT